MQNNKEEASENFNKAFGMVWRPERQVFHGESQTFVNNGITPTFPSHDLTHLLVAASSELEWMPSKEKSLTKIAEYNAVFLETLLSKVFYFVHEKYVYEPTILGASLKYLRWFAYKHYAPFPIPAEEAYCRFCCGINPEIIIRLSPYYFSQRLAEYQCKSFMQSDWEIHFNSEDFPGTTSLTIECQKVFSSIINSIARPNHRLMQAGKGGSIDVKNNAKNAL